MHVHGVDGYEEGLDQRLLGAGGRPWERGGDLERSAWLLEDEARLSRHDDATWQPGLLLYSGR